MVSRFPSCVALLLGLLLFVAAAATPARASSPLVGDFNGDCTVNILDLSMIAHRYLAARGSLLYAPMYDLNGDGVINILDIQMVAARLFTRC